MNKQPGDTANESREEIPGVARGYTRVSTDEQRRTGIGLEVQEKQIKAYFDYKLAPAGYRWGGIYRDEAVSGYKLPLLRRPAGAELHAQLRAGDCVIFAKVDRGFRRIRDCEEVVQLWDSMGVNVRFLDMDIDTRSPFGRMLLRLLSVFAEWELEIIRERNRAVASWRKEHKLPIGKHQAPVGFMWAGPPGKKKLVPAGNDREVIDRLMEWRIAGSDFDDIAIHLQKLGEKTHAGREWTARRVRKIFYKELEHLARAGVIQKAGGGYGKPLFLRWVLEKLQPERLKRLTQLYDSLGRTINDTVEGACLETADGALDGDLDEATERKPS